jgi:hypothetical protein
VSAYLTLFGAHLTYGGEQLTGTGEHQTKIGDQLTYAAVDIDRIFLVGASRRLLWVVATAPRVFSRRLDDFPGLR